MFAQIKRMANPVTEPVQSVYEQVSDQERKRLIGSAFSIGGEKWLREHPAQSSWLLANGVSLQDCLDEFHGYYARASSFEGFAPARNKRNRRDARA